MKAIILSLCTLTGVVDVHEDGVTTVVITSPAPDAEPELVTVTNQYLPLTVKEGDRVNFTVLVDETLSDYCHNPM